MKSINRFARASASASNEEDLFRVVADETVVGLGARSCVVYRLDPQAEALIPIAQVGGGNASEIRIGDPAAGQVALTGERCVIKDLSQSSGQALNMAGAGSLVCVPLFALENVVGVIECRSQTTQGFCEHTVEALSTFAVMTSAKLDALNLEARSVALDQDLAASQERFDLAMQEASDGVWDWDLASGEAYFSPRWYEMLGLTVEELPGSFESFLSLVHPEDRMRVRGYPPEAIHRGQDRLSSEFRMKHKDGHWVDVLSQAAVIRKNGLPTRVIGTHVDVSEIRAAERALQSGEERYRRLFEKFPIATMETDWSDVKRELDRRGYSSSKQPFNDAQSHEIHEIFALAQRRGVNQAMLDLFDAKDEGEIGDWVNKRFENDPDYDTFPAAVAAFFAGQASYQIELHIVTCANREKHVVFRYFLPSENRETWDRVLILVEDITERKAAEAKLLESEAIRSAFIQHSTVDMSIKDVQGRFVLVNPTAIETLGGDEKDILGKRSGDLADQTTARLMEGYDKQVLERGAPLKAEIEATFGGHKRTYLVSKFPIMDATETLLGVGTILSDITDEKHAANLLRNSETRLLEAQKAAKLGWWDADREGNTTWSESVFEIYGVPHSEFTGKKENFYRCVHPDDLLRIQGVMSRAWQGDISVHNTFRVVHPNGKVVTVRGTVELERNEQGEPVRLKGTVQDISEQALAEEKLRMAQKMEAIGQLTGGIAHDFNNLLAVIQGCAEFLEEEPTVDQNLVAPILRSTAKGAALTRRLLAYARQQPLMPKTISLADLVVGMKDLLIRTLGQTIQVQNIYRENLWSARADPGQVEDALLNLAINARDAMPDGGTLSIDCSNVVLGRGFAAQHREVEPGDYVMLTVTDTGTGMSDEVQKQAFEPFYTTKEVGQGSGLGLSMVYGFVQQSGGHVEITSTLGEGTEVRIYLPRDQQAGQAPVEAERSQARAGNGEKVLIIEDDPAVRLLAERMVTQLGYVALAVPDAQTARTWLEDDNTFDVILSDVVLSSGMSGPDFAAELRSKHPDAKIIFMSGHAAESAMRVGRINSDDVLVTKPFTREILANALADMLSAT